MEKEWIERQTMFTVYLGFYDFSQYLRDILLARYFKFKENVNYGQSVNPKAGVQ